MGLGAGYAFGRDAEAARQGPSKSWRSFGMECHLCLVHPKITNDPYVDGLFKAVHACYPLHGAVQSAIERRTGPACENYKLRRSHGMRIAAAKKYSSRPPPFNAYVGMVCTSSFKIPTRLLVGDAFETIFFFTGLRDVSHQFYLAQRNESCKQDRW